MSFKYHHTVGSPATRFRQCAFAVCALGCATNLRANPPRHSSKQTADSPHAALIGSQSAAAPQRDATAAPPENAHPKQEDERSVATISELPSSLPIDPFEPAMLRFASAQSKAPLFVITHGAGGMAQWHCQHYASLLGPGSTLLCPRGKRMFAKEPGRGYYYPDHLALAEELQKARSTILEHYATRIYENSTVYVGYSQGATMGVLAVAEHGDWWPRLLLVEGGYDNWSRALAKRYAKSGGQRVLFVCGTAHCRERARASVTLLIRAGVAAQLRIASGAGHRPDGPVAVAVRDGLSWLLKEGGEFSKIRDYLAGPDGTRQANENPVPVVDGGTPK